MTSDRSKPDGLLVRKLAGTDAPFAVFDGELPTAEQLAWIEEQKLGVHVLQMPPDVSDLSFLRPLGAGLAALTVTDWACRDIRVVEQLTGLRELHLWVDSRYSANLSALTLTDFAGRWHRSLESIFDSATLTKLMLEGALGDVLSKVPRTVQSLRLSGIKGRRFEVAALGAHEELLKLDLARASEVDLTGVEALSGLEELRLGSVSTVVGAPALAMCQNLRRLVLEDCKTVEGLLSGLEAPGLEHVLIIGRPPWRAAADRVVVDRGLGWVTPVDPYR